MKPLALDLFCGAGGASLGLEWAGYSVVGIDNWHLACATHAANGMHAIQADLRSFDWDGVKFHGLDLLWASPPCQPFSSAGRNKGSADKRDCVPDFLRAVGALRSPVVIFENVRGLTFKKHRPYLEWLLGELGSFGYVVEWRVLNCADYGLPQTRQRLFIIATLDAKPVWPMQTHAKGGNEGLRPWVSMAEALHWDSGRLNPGATPSQPHRRRYGLDEPPTIAFGHDASGWCWELHTNRDQRADGARQTRPVSEPAPTVTAIPSQWKWALTRPATTVVGSFRPDIIAGPGYRKAGDGPRQNAPGSIPVTTNQAAILQGFPDDYGFVGSKSAIFQQIGNAVPPRMAQALAEVSLGGTSVEQVA